MNWLWIIVGLTHLQNILKNLEATLNDVILTNAFYLHVKLTFCFRFGFM